MSQSDLTKGAVPRALARLTAPMIMGVSSSILVQTLEMGFIGQLSTQHVAAITFTFPATMILTSIALGISIGTSSVIARSVGEGASVTAQRLAVHSLMLVTAVMALLSTLAFVYLEEIFRAMGASDALLPLIQSYMYIYLPGVVMFTLTMIASSIMRANGNAGIPGTVMTLGALLNLALDPVLIFGWFGMPRLELAGAAIAMTITRVATSAVLLYYLCRAGQLLRSDRLRGFVESTRRIMHVGLPATATQLIGPVTAAIITRLLSAHGEVVVAGFGVATRLEAVAAIALFALSGSIGPFVGQNWGAGEVARVRAGIRTSYMFCIGWGLTAAALLFFFGPSLAGLVDDNPLVLPIAAVYLTLVPWSYGLWGTLMMSSASFNALGKPLPGTVLSLVRMVVLYVPMAAVFDAYWGYTGIFVATMLSNIIMGVCGMVWLRQRVHMMVLAAGSPI